MQHVFPTAPRCCVHCRLIVQPSDPRSPQYEYMEARTVPRLLISSTFLIATSYMRISA
jgi:hypothetical protein